MSDLIDRDSLIKEIKNVNTYDLVALKKVERAPAVDAAPVVHGRWILVDKAYGEYECSACGACDSDCSDYYGAHNVLCQDYCPNCGARMDEAAVLTTSELKACPFCNRKHPVKQYLNIICSCGSKFSVNTNKWLNRNTGEWRY